ncbi:HD domain-containing phosphohydrolase [Streptomyces sp. NPDC085927]|uniref:HD domain-containing phosphohydrolase n=1 Tax=Streptomyces sp. NPDC085927 TaxID=3365738 RepID=UPI0037D7321F
MPSTARPGLRPSCRTRRPGGGAQGRGAARRCSYEDGFPRESRRRLRRPDRGLSPGARDDEALNGLHSAALLHDLGRVVVPAGVWDRPGSLTVAETEQVRMHTYWTHRILQRVPALATLAPIASAHHERADGGGYHRGAPVRDLPLAARILAAADTLAALTEPRAHRPAYSLADAAKVLVRDADEGGADKRACALVLEAAGVEAPRQPPPDGLTDREVQVLRLAARGLTNRQIGGELSISPRTVDHHLTHIYDKAGRRTRAGIALYAMEHALLPLKHAGSWKTCGLVADAPPLPEIGDERTSGDDRPTGCGQNAEPAGAVPSGPAAGGRGSTARAGNCCNRGMRHDPTDPAAAVTRTGGRPWRPACASGGLPTRPVSGR